jgi:hypothetical protein
MYFGRCQPTLRRNVSPPSSGSKSKPSKEPATVTLSCSPDDLTLRTKKEFLNLCYNQSVPDNCHCNYKSVLNRIKFITYVFRLRHVDASFHVLLFSDDKMCCISISILSSTLNLCIAKIKDYFFIASNVSKFCPFARWSNDSKYHLQVTICFYL